MANQKNVMVHGSAMAVVREFTPADTGFSDKVITSATTYNGSVIDVTGYVSFMVGIIVDNGGGSDATQGTFTLSATAYAADGTTAILPSTDIAVQNAVLSDDRIYTVCWVEGDTGEGENVTSVDCKSLVALQKVKFSLTVATGYDNGPWTADMYVVASR